MYGKGTWVESECLLITWKGWLELRTRRPDQGWGLLSRAARLITPPNLSLSGGVCAPSCRSPAVRRGCGKVGVESSCALQDELREANPDWSDDKAARECARIISGFRGIAGSAEE